MSSSKNLRKLLLAYAIGALVASPGPLLAAATDIARAPLAQPAGTVKPNMLLILDDSGSMSRQFTPDYVSTNTQAGAVRNCFDARDFNNPPTATNLRDCFAGDPPGMTADFNTQFYDPTIRYFPAVNFDGSSRGDMNCTATGGTLVGGVCTNGWTAVPTDNVSRSGSNIARKGLHLPVNEVPNTGDDNLQWGRGVPGTPLMTMNLVTAFPDRVWCNSQGAAATDTANCKTNSAYTYPNNVFGYGTDGSGNRKYRLGPPYYYRILATEFCKDATLTDCTAATAPTGLFTVPAPVRFCTDATHTTCQAKRTTATTYCDSAALTNCQATSGGAFTFAKPPAIFPKFLGKLNTSPATPGTLARGIITLTQGDTGAPTINQITVTLTDLTTVNLLGAPLTTAATDTAVNRTTAATSIRNAINLNFGLHGYVASLGPTGGAPQQIRVDTPTIPPADNVTNNGSSITVAAPAGTPTPATVQFTIGSAAVGDRLNALRIGPPGGPAEDLIPAAGVGCPLIGCNNNSMAQAIRDAINSLTGTHGYTATVSSATVTVTAPAGTGSERNGWPMVFSTGGLTPVAGSLGNGITPGDLSHTTTNFTGGIDANPYRVSVGNFVRTSIVPGRTYPKFAGRGDCAGATSCTYDEEMTNFANWFAYYRTRIQMAKTSIGRAFLTLTDDFRVVFKTINFSTTHYLRVDDYVATAGGQKDVWYQRLYGAMTDSTGSTPLRLSLARAGRYYGDMNPNSMGASPIQKACQANYTILTSDGYWNDTSNPKRLNGSTDIGNQDGTDAGYSTKAVGAWDGNNASNTLADTAMYYYKTDLRPDLPDVMPTTQQSPDIAAPHQHMVTFTVGMGLAGSLTYDANYQTQTAGDFVAIKQGTKFWPIPTSAAETTLDDLWHAAVNGRGRFFSAQDPVALANGIADTLNQVAAKLGAGAAAATSNLQPVAGDNFAFTAQYRTVEWSGDLRARTIDLSSGIVASRELWSAQSLLDQRPHFTRRIYIFDASDTDNLNNLKVFCWPGARAVIDATSPPDPLYTGCQGEPELSAAELSAHFDPLGGPNGGLFQSIPWPTDGSNRHLAATSNNLVDFIRGDTVNETTGGFSTTDLYRNRAHLLGDIVNAQPAYVKAPPFNYVDPFYIDYKNAKTPRRGTVFAAANDGMLHAFETDPDGVPYFQTGGIATPATLDDTFSGTLSTNPVSGEGSERWAYIPTMVLPTLKRLAETNYATNHRFSVDGSPAVGDICFDHTLSTPCSAESKWRTVLVAGLNAGGRGYYALDIADPLNPTRLVELKGGTGTTCLTAVQANSGTFGEDCNIGLTFGNPIIVKRPSDGRWVVIATSGHNNVNPGDGKGYVYIIDAKTGKILQRFGTGVGCDGVSSTAPCVAGTVDPGGLARINAWVDDATRDNTARTIYAGDLKGNVWRFQLEFVENNPSITTDDVAAGSVTLLASLVDGSSNPQPVTTKVELGEVQGSSGNKYRFVFVATGRFLGESDKADTQRQTVYAIKDPLLSVSPTTPIHSSMRTSGDFVQQVITLPVGGTRSVSNNTVDVDTRSGWFVDLPDGGTGSPATPTERVNVDPVLQLGTLVVPSNVPAAGDDCVAGGTGWINFFNYKTGSYVDGATDNMLSVQIPASLVVGINVIQLPGGDVKTIVTTADNQQLTENTPVSAVAVQGRRVSWRELLVQ